eukprot:TRINITY_DN6586_c0_g1_i1.p1 TRINITY_DN6586_c0_g1~~TRINITY_DN6586_c0_g1_i1.p1  ORF type:complete len:386 (+),score=96.10 TRINITY_DN6586_c0_g1_i1:107-1159(+)
MPAASVETVTTEQVDSACAGKMLPNRPSKSLDELECPICKNTAFGDPVCTPCEHVFHEGCLQDALEVKLECPVCRKELASEDDYEEVPLYVRNILNTTDVKCPQGCGAVMEFQELDNHVYSPLNSDGGCPETTFRCANEGCRAQPFRRNNPDHVGRCQHATVSCDLCQESRKRKAIQEHKRSECVRRKVECAHCGRTGIVYADMHVHELNSCTGLVEMHRFARLRQRAESLESRVADLEQQAAQQSRPPQFIRVCIGGTSTTVARFRDEYAGVYTLLPEEYNGAPMWGRGHTRRICKAHGNRWVIVQVIPRTMQTVNYGGLQTGEAALDMPYGCEWSPVPRYSELQVLRV